MQIPFILSVVLLTRVCIGKPSVESDSDDLPLLPVLPPEEIARMTKEAGNIRFLLRDRRKNEWHPLFYSNVTIPDDIWIPGGDVKLIIHGYTVKLWQTVDENIAEQGIFDLGIEYTENNSTYNVLVVDWTILSTESLSRYWVAAHGTRFAGEAAAKFLIQLHKDSYIKDWDRVHAIGLSLGGHTVGVVGAKMQDLAGVKIGRITGLDPAGPLFDVNGENLPDDLTGFLDKSDAKFVDVIHSNLRTGEALMMEHLGSCVQSGHADFYPDGGEQQSSCTSADDILEACSHIKSVEYMRLSLKQKLLACPCQDWSKYEEGKCPCTLESGGSLMGEPCTSSASGKYFLQMK